MGNIHGNGNQAGSFTFGRGATGLVGVNSGSPIASFLLGAVDSANATFRAVDSAYPRQNAWVLYAGDTWRANAQLTIDYGLRWDYYSPSSEKYDRFSFFDPTGANPGAGGRPGRLAFAGDGLRDGQLSAPAIRRTISTAGLRRGSARVYRFNDKTVFRSRVGHLLHAGLLSRAGAEGSRRTASRRRRRSTPVSAASSRRSSSSRGCRRTSRQPPLIRSDYRNGQDLLYRPVDANKRPYSHQWNITVDRELGREPLGERRPTSAAPDGGCRRASSRSTPSIPGTCRWAMRSTTSSRPA